MPQKRLPATLRCTTRSAIFRSQKSNDHTPRFPSRSGRSCCDRHRIRLCPGMAENLSGQHAIGGLTDLYAACDGDGERGDAPPRSADKLWRASIPPPTQGGHKGSLMSAQSVAQINGRALLPLLRWRGMRLPASNPVLYSATVLASKSCKFLLKKSVDGIIQRNSE
jgi:hypothetical protein